MGQEVEGGDGTGGCKRGWDRRLKEGVGQEVERGGGTGG